MMESPEARALAAEPWLFGRQGLGVLAVITALAATFLATDVTYLAGALLLVGLGARAWAALALVRVTYTRAPSRSHAFAGDRLVLESVLANPRVLPLPWIEIWEQLPDALAPRPGEQAERREQLTVLTKAIEAELTPRQREVFVAIALNDVPIDVLAVQLGSNRNAIYKNLFDARRRLRASLAAAGYPIHDEEART